MPILLNQPFGKFRKLLRIESYLRQESIELKPYLEFLEESFINNTLSPIEIISLFVILYQYSRIKDKPFQRNPSHKTLNLTTYKNIPLEFDFLYTKLNNIPQFLNNYSFRYLPTSIREVLLLNFIEEEKLILKTDIPTSKEMLSMQAKGKRYITIDFSKAIAGNLVDDKRDAFEFVLHDLEHAYCFFKKENEYEKQILFYKSIQTNYHLLEPLTKENTQFKEDLEYCISDMNSHPDHLLNYLKAILIKYFLWKNNKQPDGRLTESELIPLNEIIFFINSPFIIIASQKQ